MNFGKTLIVLVVLFAVLGAFSFVNSLGVVSAQNGTNPGGQTWIQFNKSSLGMTQLTATIHICIKNNKDHIQIFKISQIYSDSLTTPLNFTIDWTDPPADKMIDAVSPQLGGDYGWEIQPGETKEVAFKLSAKGLFGDVPSGLRNLDAVNNTFWPLIPDQGLDASWFMPNEIEMLNPDLDLKTWKGTFTFTLTNFDSLPVVGIVRGPIIPTDSQLTASDPLITFEDKDIALNANVAAWDVHMDPNAMMFFSYTYEWPLAATNNTNGSVIGNGSSFVVKPATTNATTVPSKTTGVPYGLLVTALLIVGAGVGYAKFLR